MNAQLKHLVCDVDDPLKDYDDWMFRDKWGRL